MEIKQTSLEEVTNVFAELKPDLIDAQAVYIGAYINGVLVGIVAYVEHPMTVYLCHDYVCEKFRGNGIYRLLCNYRESEVKKLGLPINAHCNTNSIKTFLNMGYSIEKTLFKVVKP